MNDLNAFFFYAEREELLRVIPMLMQLILYREQEWTQRLDRDVYQTWTERIKQEGYLNE